MSDTEKEILKSKPIYLVDEENRVYRVNKEAYVTDRKKYREHYENENKKFSDTAFYTEINNYLSNKAVQNLEKFLKGERSDEKIKNVKHSTWFHYIGRMSEFFYEKLGKEKELKRNADNKLENKYIPYLEEIGTLANLVEAKEALPKKSDCTVQLDSRTLEQIRKIFGQLLQVVSCIEKSDHFNNIPGTYADGWSYFEDEILNIRNNVLESFIGQQSVIARFEQIISETEIFIKSCSVPGVVDRWQEINPAIGYFDCVYDFISESPKEYEKIKNGDNIIHFAFYPTEEDIRKRSEYFEKIERDNREKNLQYSEDRIFQNEIVNTLLLVMQKDFPELSRG